MAILLCEHYTTDRQRAKCRACLSGIYRAIQRVEAKEKAKKTFQPIDVFEDIPEIQDFIAYQKAKGVKYKALLNRLKYIWEWVRENPQLARKQRPILWDTDIVKFALAKVDELQITRYIWIQALRQFFKSCGKHRLCEDPLLRAKAKHLRSHKNHELRREYLTIEEFKELVSGEPLEIEVYLWLGVVVGGRPGNEDASMLGSDWEQVNWQKRTINIYEPKTGGGTWWLNCPLDLFGDVCFELLRELHQKQGSPKKGRIFQWKYHQLKLIFYELSEKIGRKVLPSDLRDTHATWLRDLGLSDLAIGVYDARTGKALGLGGVGWENPTIFYQRYGRVTPKKLAEMQSLARKELSIKLA